MLIVLIDELTPNHGGAQRRHPLLTVDQHFSAGR
jgi:hypothetical protein